MRKLLAVVVAVLAGCAVAPAGAGSSPGRGAPEEQGVSSAAILSFLDAADKIDAMNSVMILRHGRVIAEGWWAPYDAGSNHELYSLSKSFTSTAVGLAVAEGKLSIDDEVLKFFPEDAPAAASANLKAMRVRDLLTMTAGHQDETSSAADRITAKAFLAHPVPHKPGTHFRYNTPATFMLSAIVQKATGQTVLEYLKPRLFEPLGISQPVWNANAQGISLGGYGLRVRTEDIARFGQLYLQRGRWEGKQLVPEAWVDLATSRQVSNGSNPKSDWDQGYGFQFWRCRQGAYRGDGAFGQYCIVLPQQDAVIAITSGLRDMQAVLNLVWDKLLPGFREGTLPADPDGVARLRNRLSGLQVGTEQGTDGSLDPKFMMKKYVFPANDQQLEWIQLKPDPAGARLALRINGADREIPFAFGKWVKGRGSFGAYLDEPAAASGRVLGANSLLVKQVFTETPYHQRVTLEFAEDRVSCLMEMNVGFGSTKRPPVTGKAGESSGDAPRSPADALRPFVDRHVLAGAVTLVATKDRILSKETVGFLDIAAKARMRPDAMFWIASQSKPMTAAAFMMLVDEGKVTLDDPVEKYLPEFKGLMVAAEQDDQHSLLKKPVHPITVRNVLSHTSGMRFSSPAEKPTLDMLPLQAAVRSYAMMPLQHEPDSKYQYSNAGINTAARILEVVSGMAYEDFMQKRLFDPLGMKDTTFWLTPEQVSRLAKSYKPNAAKDGLEETTIGQLTYPLTDRRRQPMPAGGLFSTATDVAKFCQMVLNGGELGGKRLLSEAAVRQMTMKQTGENLKDGYGLGWSTGGGSYGHGGALATNMSIDPKRGLITVFLVQHSGFPGDGAKSHGAWKQAAEQQFGP